MSGSSELYWWSVVIYRQLIPQWFLVNKIADGINIVSRILANTTKLLKYLSTITQAQFFHLFNYQHFIYHSVFR